MKIEHQIGMLLKKRRLTIAVAESCTGGLISHLITNVPGCSCYFERSFIVYSNKAKTDMLSVKPATIKKHGAVSMQTAVEMAKGVRSTAKTDIGLAVTGIAGPGGGSAEKPVGLVFIAIAYSGRNNCEKFLFNGKRETIKLKTSQHALMMVKEYLIQSNPKD